MQITAKIRCATREQVAGPGEARVTFAADYTDEHGNRVNEEWAKYTPGFSLAMVVLDSVPFEVGTRYTLTFDDGQD